MLDGGDALLDLLGGSLGLSRQLPDFLCHHGEATAMLAGTGCLDGGVQGQEIGLLGDGGNGLHDLADLLGVLPQLLHHFGAFHDPLLDGPHLLDGIFHHIGPCLGRIGGLHGGCRHRLGLVSHFRDIPEDQIHIFLGSVNIRQLLAHARRHIPHGLSHMDGGLGGLVGAGGELLGRSRHLL